MISNNPTRMFLVGLTVPALALVGAFLLVRPDSLLQWVAVGVSPFVASSVVAMVFAYRARGPLAPPPRPGTRVRPPDRRRP